MGHSLWVIHLKFLFSEGEISIPAALHLLPNMCNYCGEMFPDYQTYKIHKKKYKCSDKHKCNYCPYMSVSLTSLRAHSRITHKAYIWWRHIALFFLCYLLSVKFFFASFGNFILSNFILFGKYEIVFIYQWTKFG